MLRTALLFATFALSSVDARAHAPPYATGIEFVATSAGERVMVRTNRGLIVGSREAGFRLVCNDAFGANLSEVVPVARLADGGVLVGTFANGLLRADPTYCDFDAVGPTSVSPIAVERGAGGLVRALLLPLDGSDGALFESVDGGASFAELAQVGTAPNALLTAPSSPERVYVSTTTTEGNLSTGHVLTSRDGGRQFTDYAIELDGSELRAFALAVDANDPDKLFVGTQSRDAISLERLLVSEDAGETFRTALSARGPLTLALGDGADAWVGGADGLYRSRDGAATFEKVPDTGLSRIGCLASHAGKLYACALNGFEFGVLVSEDGGTTFRWFLRFPDVTARAACAPSSDEGSSCALAFEDWSREQLFATGEPIADPPAMPDSAPSEAASESAEADGAAGCTTSAPAKRGARELLVLAVMFGLWGSRRRKHHG